MAKGALKIRTIEELEQYITWCDGCTKENDLERLWMEWFRAVTCDIEPDRLKEICEAERDGRLAALPHPIGCKVYHIETDGVLKGMIREVTVAGYSENKWQGRANSEKDHRFVIFHNSYNQPIACQLCNVYRTREQAEQALKGGAE